MSEILIVGTIVGAVLIIIILVIRIFFDAPFPWEARIHKRGGGD